MSFSQLWLEQDQELDHNKPELVQELLIKVEPRLELELKLELELIASDCKAFAHSDGGLCRF